MRKILLASTALVALTSVSAMAADVSISGSSEIVLDMGDSATADQSAFAVETDVNINFSNTTDSGISTSLNYGVDEGGANDDMIVTITGDFGSISYTDAGDDHALTAADNEASGTPEENTGTLPSGSYTGGLPSIGDTHMTWKLPTIVDSLGVAVSVANDSTSGEAASYAVTYAAGPLALVYGEVRGHTQTDTHVGASVSMGAAKIMVAKNSNDQAAHSNEATLIGATYVVSPELTLGVEVDKGETGTTAEDFSMTAMGATYVIAPGLKASFTSTETDSGTDANDSNYTSVGLHLSW